MKMTALELVVQLQMDHKKKEGEMVRAFYKSKKQQEKGLTQEKLADELGVTQGLVTQWFTGRVRIPDQSLLLMSQRLSFDALEVRPALKEDYDLATKVLGDARSQGRDILDDLTPDEYQMVLRFAKVVVSERESQ